MKTKLQKLSASIQKARDQVRKAGGEAFYEEFKPLFEKYPEVETVSWTQYTPYFNDGDTCEFGVHEINVNGEDSWSLEYHKNPLHIAAKEFEKIHRSVDSDLFLAAFGDHVEIIISRDGKVAVDEYDHE